MLRIKFEIWIIEKKSTENADIQQQSFLSPHTIFPKLCQMSNGIVIPFYDTKN
jgi:hypothetical protein